MMPVLPCRLMILYQFLTRAPPRSTLSPYTTLFRSRPRAPQSNRAGRAAPPPSPRRCRAAPCSRPSHPRTRRRRGDRSEEHTSELQSLRHLVCRLLLEKKKPTVPFVERTDIATPLTH